MTDAIQQPETTIIRVAHGKDNPYVMIRRDSLQDKNLSWEARGMLSYLLSQADDWQVKPKDLQQHCGRDKVYSILKELLNARYVSYKEIRDPQTQHVIASDYTIHEKPLPALPYTANTDGNTKEQEEHNADTSPSTENVSVSQPSDKADEASQKVDEGQVASLPVPVASPIPTPELTDGKDPEIGRASCRETV